ncbi:hypothetical protein LPJ73_003342 [Coemansia sp. RSA 2703]|nr:hypothetical protein LPJ73_003342 [Coemansia sp. RSA 2703]KAJ2373813.1 hypothetical protein IW150_003436 [Coemansia sp. RSA 2607]KAJ2388895.1 hypothetical protein GGI05_003658 [Coemansia sp. RSA 2603]
MSANASGSVPAHPQPPPSPRYSDVLRTGLPAPAASIPAVPSDIATSDDPEGPFTLVSSTRGPRTAVPAVPVPARDQGSPAHPPSGTSAIPKSPLSLTTLNAIPRSVMAKTPSKPNPSTRRGPTDEELARKCTANPVFTVPTAWLHFPGAGPSSIRSVVAHRLAVENLPEKMSPEARAHPIFLLVLGYPGCVGFVFKTITHLQQQISRPPSVGGNITPWRTPEGVFTPFWMTGAPAAKESCHMVGALRQFGRVYNLQRAFFDGFLTSDWSGLLAVPEGRDLPGAIRFQRKQADTTI